MSIRKTITLNEPLSGKINELAKLWDVPDSEAMRRLFGLGGFVVEELKKGHEIMTKAQDEANPSKVIFPWEIKGIK